MKTIPRSLLRVRIHLPISTKEYRDAGGGGFLQKIAPDALFVSNRKIITHISPRNSTITFAMDHNFKVGQLLRLKIPKEWGMAQADGKEVRIKTIVSSNSVTVEMEATRFNHFTLPATDLTQKGLNYAQAIPIGSQTAPFDEEQAFQAKGFRGVKLGSDIVGADTHKMVWEAFVAEHNF